MSLRLLFIGLIGAFGMATLAHACTLPKSYYKHVKCTTQSGVFLAVKDNGSPVALLDKKGNATANLFAYDAVLPNRFYAGLLPVRQGKKIGYINKRGKVVIPLIYDSLGGSEWARGALGGRIVVKKNGAFGMIDTNNRTIIAFDKSIRHLGDISKGSAAITRAGKQYRIDINDNPLSTTTQTTTDDTTATSSRPIRDSDFFPRQQEGRWGFVDSEGTPMIVFAFDEVRPYSEGLAAVRQGEFWGFINHAGQLVIEFRFDNAGIIADSTDSPHLPTSFVFSQGKAWIGNLNNGDKLCINAQGVNVNCHNP